MKEKIIEIGKKLDLKGFAPGISGNISVRCEDAFYISASGKKLSELSNETVVKVDLDGILIEGDRKPSSEKNLHSGIYKLREDINAIIHCHSPKIATLSVCHIPMDKKLLADCVYYFDKIPLVSYAMPSSEELVQNTLPFFEKYNAVILANHGFLVGAKNLDEAFYLAETAEFNAEVYINSLILNRINSLNEQAIADIDKLAGR